MNKSVFITGGTGYIGSRVIPGLINCGYKVKALVRKGSEKNISYGCELVYGDALDGTTYANQINGCNTFIHLIGVHHPGPGKKNEFQKIDLASIEQAVPAAANAGVKHFIYLSVAHPAPAMKEFIEVRKKGEELISKSGLAASFIRPWYVLGPGHYWPYLIIPFYKIFELIPGTRQAALRLGLVKINQMIKCIIHSVQNPPEKLRIYDVKDIKKF